MRPGRRDDRSTRPVVGALIVVLASTLLAVVVNLITNLIRVPGGKWSVSALGAGVLLLAAVLAVVEVRRQRAPGLEQSRDLAEHVSVSIQWADSEVRAVDRLRPDEQYWVVYIHNSGDKPVHEVDAFADGGPGKRRTAIRFPVLEPNRRQWYILRPAETGFEPDGDIPRSWIEFTAVGQRWRSTDGHLERLLS